MEDTFKCFGDDDFDVKKWVNAQVRSGEAMSVANPNAKGSSVDDHLATLVVKLQLLTQSSSKTIDEHSTVCPLLDILHTAAYALLYRSEWCGGATHPALRTNIITSRIKPDHVPEHAEMSSVWPKGVRFVLCGKLLLIACL